MDMLGVAAPLVDGLAFFALHAGPPLFRRCGSGARLRSYRALLSGLKDSLRAGGGLNTCTKG